MEKQGFFSMAAILNIAKNGGSIKISGCFHQNCEMVWHGGHLCQMSCFCPDVKMYYIKSPHYKKGYTLDLLITRDVDPTVIGDINITAGISDHSAIIGKIHVQRPTVQKKS